jgi:hypothetical protein
MLHTLVSVVRGPVKLFGFAVLAAGLVAGLATAGAVLVTRVAGGSPVLAVALLASVVVVIGAAVTRVYRRRVRGRRWEPLHRAMIRDADTILYTYLAQIHTRPEPATRGLVIATDLRNGGRGPLWLGGEVFPVDAVVCFTSTATGPHIRSWMTGGLWRACSKHAAHTARRAARADLRARRLHQRHTERHIRRAASQVVCAAEEIVREHASR